ncbi:cation diffusion facilitator family transporter [Jeotgalibacillus haloalkalitolerans]|uniref:Cation diffusion facilitator family transporter n=1 Tax=Jeotgalibacillus haloalkalitolerans TaxID=3104292 RepID=A0ABU5KNE3_9BACL|nr:cation diffusion facilitator family transporter [Jeotgalibacillus sp. HH7-29]MDZ5712776.1 cation diffusion facilitator family transporter [Jeotgalibacillus sp. HH7-29]
MGHGHDHAHTSNKKALLFSFIIITGFMIVEAIGGFLTNSLALLSDAGHMLSDSISLGVGLLAFTLGERAADRSKTYGYKRFEILAAVFNGVTLVLIAFYIFYEAFQRFSNPPEIASTGMLIIAILGLIVNIVVAWLLMRKGDTKDNLNLRAAFLHVIGDLLGSVGAITAALLIIFFNWGWADPLASVIVAVLVLISGWRVTKDSIHVLMEGTPENIDLERVIGTIKSVSGIRDIHDLHVWSITSGNNALSCHAVVDGSLSILECQELLREVEHKLAHEMIGHVTIQLEDEAHPHDETVMCCHQNEHAH